MRLGGVIPLKAVESDLQSVCEEVVLEVQASHPDAIVNFESRGDVKGKWDPDRLAQVVSNLVVNAIEYGRNTPLSLVASEAGERVRLLGLFIARAIVVARGGEIRVTSTAESGTTFEVTLPRHRDVPPEPTADGPSR